MTSQSNLRKRAIFASALALIEVHGLHGTPTARIAKEAGISNGTLFHYFPSKEKLINSLYINLSVEMLKESTQELERIAGLRGMIRYIWNRRLNYLLKNPSTFLFIRQFEASPYYIAFQNDEIKELEHLILSLLKQARERHMIADIPAELQLRMLFREVDAVVEYNMQQEDILDDNYGHTVFQLFWKAMKREAAQ